MPKRLFSMLCCIGVIAGFDALGPDAGEAEDPAIARVIGVLDVC